MKRILEFSKTPLTVGITAAIIIFIDSLIAPLFVKGATFVWISFINWTVFSDSTKHERLKAIIGYIIGFVSANLMILIGNNLENILPLKIGNVTLAVIIATFLINFLVMYLNNAKKLYLDAIPGIFVGIAITFSGAGVSLSVSSLTLLLIILIYGILGLICGFVTNKITKNI